MKFHNVCRKTKDYKINFSIFINHSTDVDQEYLIIFKESPKETFKYFLF